MTEYSPSPLDDQVRELHAQGLHLRQIARKLNVEKEALRLIFVNLGLKQQRDQTPRPEELDEMHQLAADGLTVAEIALEMLIAPQTVKKHLTGTAVLKRSSAIEERKKQRLAAVLELHREGLAPKEIRERLGISRSTYSGIASELGITQLHAKPRTGPAEGNQHGVIGGAFVASGCECDLCSSARERKNRKLRDDNHRSSEKARNSNSAWTGPELEIVARPDLTTKQKAELTGRTLSAVTFALSRLRTDPKWKATLHVSPPPSQQKIKPSDIVIMVDRSLTIKEAARQVGCSVHTVTRYRSLDKAKR